MYFSKEDSKEDFDQFRNIYYFSLTPCPWWGTDYDLTFKYFKVYQKRFISFDNFEVLTFYHDWP